MNNIGYTSWGMETYHTSAMGMVKIDRGEGSLLNDKMKGRGLELVGVQPYLRVVLGQLVTLNFKVRELG